MKLEITQSIQSQYPDLRIGVLVAKGIDNYGINPELERIKTFKEEALKSKFTVDSLRSNPFILAWQETYRSFGVNPKKKVPTAESLLTRILKGGSLPSISKLVDSYLMVEMDYLCPIGGYDLDCITGDIGLRHSPGNEGFFAIGSEFEEKTEAGEVVYADKEKILTRRWNYRDCEKSKITSSSRNIILMSEATNNQIPSEHLEASIAKLEGYIKTFCGGEVSTWTIKVSDLQ